ncbi:MAG: hypothetical protein M0D55_16720 [Elusimicrobiota bacterium]|nr:MAG: hypothetical protein M0D55_16720 [Elusimicrobiota bacterium]
MSDPLAEKRGRLLAQCADLPRRCRLVEASEGGAVSRKLEKLRLFGGRYLTWAAARAGLAPETVEFPCSGDGGRPCRGPTTRTSRRSTSRAALEARSTSSCAGSSAT